MKTAEDIATEVVLESGYPIDPVRAVHVVKSDRLAIATALYRAMIANKKVDPNDKAVFTWFRNQIENDFMETV